MSRYLSCVRPGIEFDTDFTKPRNFRAFLSDLLYFDFDVEFGAFYASVHVAVFGFGFKVSVNDPLEFSIRLDAPCADARVDFGLRYDWERADLFREADDKRERFLRAVNESRLSGVTLDVAAYNDADERKARIRKVRRDFSHSFWNGLPDGDIDIGNAVFIVFKEDGVYAEVRPEAPASYEEIYRGLTEAAQAKLNDAADKIFPTHLEVSRLDDDGAPSRE